MPDVSCKKCGNTFYAKPNWLKRGYGKFCSINCTRLASRRGSWKACCLCKEKVYKSLKDIRRSKSGNFFCSKRCSLKWLRSKQFGRNHANWKHGKYAYRGMLLRSALSRKCKLCGRDDERILIVHHIDKNRENNKIDNLTWLCLNCHYLVHNYSEAEDQFLDSLNT